jgi:hypothetical protein
MLLSMIRVAPRPGRQCLRGRRAERSFSWDTSGLPLETRLLLSNVSVLQYRNDAGNTGQNLQETTLTTNNVNPTDFGELYQYPVDGYVYAQPLYMANLAIPGQGAHNVVFVATENDSVYAFDANGNVGPNGAPIWHDSFIDPSAGITTLDQYDVFGVSDLVPQVGITATPVIDPATGALYVVTKTKNIEDGVEHVVQQLHALDVATGAEMFGGPVTIADTTVNPDGSYTYNSGPSVAGTGDGSVNGVLSFNALSQNERAALVLNNGVIYLSYSSHGDTYPNHGWILGYNAQTLQQTAVFCTTPNGSDGTIWGSGEGLAVDPQGNMYFVTGNGTFDTTFVPGPGDPSIMLPSQGDYGDSVVKIAVDPATTASNPNINGWGLKVLDYFTPSDQNSLNNNDTDYGSGGPLLLPATATGPQVLLTAGKDGTIYVLNTDTGKMGEYNSSANNVYQEIQNQLGGGMWGTPVYFKGSVYYGPVDGNLEAFQLEANNKLSTSPKSTSPENFGYPGADPAISADGNSNGIVWAVDNSAYGGEGPAVLYAYDATNLANELYNSTDSGNRDQAGGAVKFTNPIITNGMVYVGGESTLTIYGLLAGVVVPTAPSNLKATGISNDQIALTWQNNSATETSFTIERSTSGGNFTPVASVGAYADAYTDGDLAPSAEYVYEVVATNSAGSSAPSNQASARTTASTLPSPWRDADVGAPSISGSASCSSGAYTVFGSGNQIGGTADQFNFVCRALAGNGTIVAEVDSQDYTQGGAEAGVMMRESLNAGAPYAFAAVTTGVGVGLQWRTTQGGSANQDDNSAIGAAAPFWLILTRSGTTFTASASPDGRNWSSLGSIVVPMSTQIYVGFAVSSDDNSAVNQSIFESVSFTQSISQGYVAIDAGGGPIGTFAGDEDFSGGTTAAFSTAINTSRVTNPAPAAVYQTEHFGKFTYAISGLRPGALYTVRLHFSEDQYRAAGRRVFNVSIDGARVLSNFDVFAAAGGKDIALIEQFAATANSQGRIVIAFAPTPKSPSRNAEVSGIELVPVQFKEQLTAAPSNISAAAGHKFSGTVATFSDASPGGLARDYIATTNWGDGTVTTCAVNPVAGGSRFSITASHVYRRGGRYPVTVLIQSYDGEGAVISETAAVSGGPRRPKARRGFS